MDIKIRAAVNDPALNVRAWCRAHGVSKTTFYKWKARYLAEGLEGLIERSRRPTTSPGQTAPAVEETIVRLRKTLTDEGLDAGADTILWHLQHHHPDITAPSPATIWRVLTRHGVVTPQPRKRPRSSWKSFERERPNECWQIDASKWQLADNTPVEIIDIIDDHSRLIVAARAVTGSTTSTNAWATFCHGATHWGLPATILSDNGTPFTAALFTTNLHACGVNTINSRPYHPQTCGKIERFHQTLKKWLRLQPAATTLAEFQTQLDTFITLYNHHRPHRGISRVTPATRWHASPPAQPAGHTPTPATPTITRDHHISATGILELRPWRIHIGKTHAGHTVDIYQHNLNIAVFHNGTLIHTRTINPNSTYQPKCPR